MKSLYSGYILYFSCIFKIKRCLLMDYNILPVKNRSDFRSWLSENHDKEKECYVVINCTKQPEEDVLWYLDGVEEALCFGWIDSTTRKQDGKCIQRFSPRRKGSNWTELNKARCARLESLGLMTDAGREALSKASEFSIDSDIMEKIQSDPEIYQNFLNFPELYVRVRIYNIQSRRKDTEVFTKQLNKFLENTKKGIMYGEWNDYGRLSE